MDNFFTINADINRTGRQQLSQKQILMLFNILCAYAHRNRGLNYCQGFNQIVYFLLSMGFEEEEAFWILCFVLEQLMPALHYRKVVSILVDSRVILGVIRRRQVKLYNVISRLKVDLNIKVINWFITLFTSINNFELVGIIFEFLLFEGVRGMYKVCLVIF